METRILHSFPDAGMESLWREFLLRADFPAHYVSPEVFLEPFFADKEPFAILVLSAGRVMAVLTGIHDGKRIQCGVDGRPQLAFDRAGSAEVLREAFEALKGEGKKADLITSVTWSTSDAIDSAGFLERKSGEIVILDLAVGAQALFKQFNKGRRTDITFAIRRGVEVREATSVEDFDLYYKIYLHWCERKHLVPQSQKVMHAALCLRSNRRLFLAIHEGKAIAGSIVRYQPHGLAEYSANSSLGEALALRPNSLLVWTAIQWACAEGLRQFSMGGAHPFLRHFGGNILLLHRYRLDQSLLKRHDAREWMESKIRGIAGAMRVRFRAADVDDRVRRRLQPPPEIHL